MKYLILLGLLIGELAIAQQGFTVTARQTSQDGPITKARGDVVISNGSVRIQADSIDFNRETGELEAAGRVRIRFLSKPTGDGLQPAPVPTMQQRIERMRMMRFPPDIMAPAK